MELNILHMLGDASRRPLIRLSDYSDYCKSGFTAPIEDYRCKNVLDPMCTLYPNIYEQIVTLKVENMRSTLEIQFKGYAWGNRGYAQGNFQFYRGIVQIRL